MSRQSKPIAGIRQPFRVWRDASRALLSGPDSGKTQVLKDLVKLDPDWRARFKAWARQKQLEAVQSRMAKAGLVPVSNDGSNLDRFKHLPALPAAQQAHLNSLSPTDPEREVWELVYRHEAGHINLYAENANVA